jgi:hypothetical protein
MNGSMIWRAASVLFAGAAFILGRSTSRLEAARPCPSVEPLESKTTSSRAFDHAPSDVGTATNEVVGATEDKSALERAKADAQDLKSEKAQLKAQLSAVEAKLKRLEGPQPYAYAPTPAQWKDMAASGSIKYRIPCTGSHYRLAGKDLDNLGLSPEDGVAVNAAFQRSNERVRAMVLPSCKQIVSDEVAEMLGFDGCLSLVEKNVAKTEPLAVFDAHVAVDTAHADGTQLPDNASTLARLYYQLTGEGEQFQKDLENSLGPDEAERVWHSFPCARTVN